MTAGTRPSRRKARVTPVPDSVRTAASRFWKAAMALLLFTNPGFMRSRRGLPQGGGASEARLLPGKRPKRQVLMAYSKPSSSPTCPAQMQFECGADVRGHWLRLLSAVIKADIGCGAAGADTPSLVHFLV